MGGKEYILSLQHLKKELFCFKITTWLKGDDL